MSLADELNAMFDVREERFHLVMTEAELRVLEQHILDDYDGRVVSKLLVADDTYVVEVAA